MNSVCKDLYVLCAARWSGWIWQSPFWILAFACTVALNGQNTSQHACHGCEKRKKSKPIQFFLWRTKLSEAVCKSDWQNLRLYLFFNVRNFRMKISVLVCNDLYSSHWIVNVAYDYLGLQHPITPNPQKAHSTRRMASSWAWANSVSIQDIWLAAGWSIVNTFARFYNIHISFLSSVQTAAKCQQPGWLLLDFNVWKNMCKVNTSLL